LPELRSQTRESQETPDPKTLGLQTIDKVPWCTYHLISYEKKGAVTFLPQKAGIERRGETALRICVPAGFFERLMVAVDFRAITKHAFICYNPTHSSADADSAIFFKILLLEHILDTSSDTLHNEFNSHPRLREFLEISEQTPLPQPDEVALFRMKLGWMGFKKILDTVVQEAKKNKLSEEDCSILEKRYHSPLVVALTDTPPAAAPVAPQSTPVLASSEKPSPDSNALHWQDSEIDPLGIHHYLDAVIWGTGEAEDAPVPPDRPPVKAPVVKLPPVQSFTITSAPVRSGIYITGNLERPNEENARLVIPPVKSTQSLLELENPDTADCFDEEPFSFFPVTQETRIEKPPPPSQVSFEDHVSEESPAAPLPDPSPTSVHPPLVFTPSFELGEAQDHQATSAGMEEGEKNSHIPAHWTKDRENYAAPQQSSEGPDLFPSLAALAPKKSFFTAQVFSRPLYIAIPPLLVLAIYMLIAFLMNNQPPTMASDRNVADAASKSGTPTPKTEPSAARPSSAPDSSLQVPRPSPVNSAQVLQPVRGLAAPEKRKPAPMPLNKNAPIENDSSPVVQPSAKPSKPATPATKDASIEFAKKQALLLHLRDTYHLDIQPDQYSYEELKDILSRLEREAKKPDSQL
jgi:hypothetical protein